MSTARIAAHNTRSRISMFEWTMTFVPFGLLLTAALMLPEIVVPGGTPGFGWLDDILSVNDPASRSVPAGTAMLSLDRAILTIWVSTLLMIPALCLSVLPRRSASQTRFSQLFWTFSYVAFMFHFYYTAFIIFGGFSGTFANMRPAIADTNFVVTAIWTLDVALAWLGNYQIRYVRVLRVAIRTFIFLVFVVTELFLRPTVIQYLGIALVVGVSICLLVRLGWGANLIASSERGRT
jgi:hypothetical protein